MIFFMALMVRHHQEGNEMEVREYQMEEIKPDEQILAGEIREKIQSRFQIELTGGEERYLNWVVHTTAASHPGETAGGQS